MSQLFFAQKAFILQDQCLLLVQKSLDDPNQPGLWEVPGGRMEFGEDIPVEESDTMLDRTITDELDRIAAARSPKAISGAPISDGEGEAGVQMEKLASAA